MSSQIEALHSSIVNCLTAILKGYAQDRKPAEDELKTLEVTEGGCVHVVMPYAILMKCRVWSCVGADHSLKR